jgi:hypothetical protein
MDAVRRVTDQHKALRGIAGGMMLTERPDGLRRDDFDLAERAVDAGGDLGRKRLGAKLFRCSGVGGIDRPDDGGAGAARTLIRWQLPFPDPDPINLEQNAGQPVGAYIADRVG